MILKTILLSLLIGPFAFGASPSFKIKPSLNPGRLASDPASGLGGDMYFNTTSSQIKLYNGSSWAAVGSGGGGTGINFVGLGAGFTLTTQDDVDAETTVGNWTAYADAAGTDPVNMTGGSPNITCLRTTTAGHILNGSASFEVVKTAANRQGEGCSVLVNVPPRGRGQNTQIAIPFQIFSGSLATGDLKLAAYDVTNGALLAVGFYDVYQSQLITSNFVIPSSATQIRVGFHFASTSATAVTFNFDDVIIGPPANIGQVSQAQFIGAAYYEFAASCAGWTRSSTTLGDMASDTDCTAPVVTSNPGPGTISTTDANLPQFTVTGLPPGTYRAIISAPVQSTSGGYALASISDGTTTAPGSSTFTSAGALENFTVEGWFTYTAAGDRTFKFQAAENDGTALFLDMTTTPNRVSFTLTRYPATSEVAYRPDTIANSWSGYHGGANCEFSRTSTTLGDFTADADCNLTEVVNNNFGTVTSYNSAGSELPGITFTPSKVGTYKVCAVFNASGGAVNNPLAYQLLDASSVVVAETLAVTINVAQWFQSNTLCGLYKATSTASKTLKIYGSSAANTNLMTMGTNAGGLSRSVIEWSIFQIDQQIPAPLIINSVTNSSTGVTRTEYAKLNCDASSAITSQLGSWVSSAGNVASGACIFTLLPTAFSAAPYCVVADTNVASDPITLSVNATSSTSVTIDCADNAGTDCTAYDVTLACTGAK